MNLIVAGARAFLATTASTAGTKAATSVATPGGWKLAAVFIGLGAVLLLYVLGAAVAGSLNPYKVFKRLVEGADGLASTSKFQWLLWLVAVVFVYVALYVVRAQSGNYAAINDIPANVMTVLGFSTGTMVIAKGIRSAGPPPNPSTTAANSAQSKVISGLFADDAGVPDLGKVQMLVFTFIAIGIFIAGFFHQLAATPAGTNLPNIDGSLLVLMGISQGGYLGKKLVTSGSPVLSPFSTSAVQPGAAVTLHGTSMGQAQPGSVLMMDKWSIATTSWSDTVIGFNVPNPRPDGSLWPAGALPVQLSVIVNGQQSNSVPIPVGTVGLYEIPGGPVKPQTAVTIQGFGLGAAPIAGDSLMMDGNNIANSVWTAGAITFTVPTPQPGTNAQWPKGNTTVKISAVAGGQRTNEVELEVKGP